MSKAYTVFRKIHLEILDSFDNTQMSKEEITRLSKKNMVTLRKRHGISVDLVLRSTLVTAVAAYDRYFTDRFLEAFIPFIKKNKVKTNFADYLQECGLDVKESLNLLNHTKPRIRLKSLVRLKLRKHVTQNQKSINKLFLYYGFKDVLKSAESILKRRTIITKIDKLIELRHSIVHEGHTNNYGEMKRLDHKDSKWIMNTIADMTILIEEIDKMISSKGI